MSPAEKDHVARMVLAVVQEVGRRLDAPTPLAPEPARVFVHPEDRPFVMGGGA